MLNLFSIANASARRPPALPPFPLPSPAINLAMAPLPLIILVCLILILPTLHVCPLFQHPRTPPSSSFWACFAPATATCYVTIDCDKKKSAVLDSGASVDITSERHRTGQLNDSPEMVQGISGTTHAWPTRVQWHTKIDCGVPHLLQTEAGFEDFKQLYMPNAPDQILSLSQLV